MVLSFLGNLIGNLLGRNIPQDDDLMSPCFRPGVCIDFGICWIKFVRKVLIAGMVIEGSENINNQVKCDQVCRASDLPIYISEEPQILRKRDLSDLCPPQPGIIESTVGVIRKSIWSLVDRVDLYQQQIGDKVQDGADYANSMYKYLSEDSDDTTKMAAVGVGALTGVVFGLRGGFCRKIFYASIGAYGMSAVCYPRETKENTLAGIREARRLATVTYNFVYGVKKDDIPLPQLPKLPSTMSEVWEMAGEFGKSASSLITGGSQQPGSITEKQQQNTPEAKS